MSYHALKDVPSSHEFKVRNGASLRNLYELHRELSRISDEDFSHHVNGEKNDFHNWIKHSINDAELAQNLSTLKDRKSIMSVLGRRIRALEYLRHREHNLHNIVFNEFFLGIAIGVIAALAFALLFF